MTTRSHHIKDGKIRKARKVRGFVALPLEKTVARELSALQNRMRQRGLAARWVRPENLHVTLAFLGDVSPEKMTAAADGLAHIGGDLLPLALRVSGAGVFPNKRRPSVLWAGLQGDLPGVVAVYAGIRQMLQKLGFEQESRPFKGHVTLARMRKKPPSGKLNQALEAGRAFESSDFIVKRPVLFQSRLTPSGPVYTEWKGGVHE